VMRIALVGLALLGIVSEASAADLGDVIRGSTPYEPGVPSYHRWEGFYAGGQIGYANVMADFGNGVSSLVGFIERNSEEEAVMHVSTWTTLKNQTKSGQSYGFFAGYNSQWDDVVLGVEANYNRASFSVSDADSVSLQQTLSDGNVHGITVNAAASMDLIDYGTIRGRAGYVMGRFLPYGTLGLAVGRANITQSAIVSERVSAQDGTFIRDIPTQTATNAKAAYIWGYAAGAGLDVEVAPGIMLRAEYELVQFSTFSDMRAMMQTVRVGAGVKF
jgi:outer membrane immunogenic protein